MRTKLVDTLQDFIHTDLDDYLNKAANSISGDHRVELFQSTASSTPAYARFLSEQGISPDSIATVDAFDSLPCVNRQNYLSVSPLPDLCRNGTLEACDMVAVSSGSTGSPTFWPRTAADEVNVSWRFEQIFHDSFHADSRKTLAVVCFALGTWVGGMYTAACCRNLATKGYPVTVITPGNNREEIFRVVRELAPFYDQTVLLGYPPFLKDVIDTGIAKGIDWKPYRIRLVMAGEVFSEEWRELVAERVGCPAGEIAQFAASMYGTADAGVLGVETSLSVRVRRFLARNPQASRALFGESRLPTLVQYDPLSRFFQTDNGRLLFTGDNGVPLIRYDILDNGGVYAFDDFMSRLKQFGFDYESSIESTGNEEIGLERGVRRLPFVYVFGRSNFTISYFGANIFPENITVGLEQPGVREWTTGKFVLESIEDEDRTTRLRVTVELAPGVQSDPTMAEAAAESIKLHLERLNSEFTNYTPPEFRTPIVVLRAAGDPEYFPVGVKHRYTRK